MGTGYVAPRQLMLSHYLCCYMSKSLMVSLMHVLYCPEIIVYVKQQTGKTETLQVSTHIFGEAQAN